MNKLIWLGCLSYLINGLAHVVIGPVLEPMISHYGVNYSDGGQLIMNQFFGFLIGVLISPQILRRLGRRMTIVMALGCLTAAETVYSFLPPWGWMLTVSPVAGFGFGIVESAVGAMILSVIVEKKASAMSRVEVFFGVGALVMPGIAAILLRQGLWELSFPFVAVLSCITMCMWLFMPFGKATDRMLQAGAVTAADMSDTTREGITEKPTTVRPERRYTLSMLIAGSLFFFLYVGTEMSFANYIPSILQTTSGLNESTAAIAVSLFWGAMAIGRWLLSLIADGIRYTRFLLLTCAGTAIGLGLISLTSSAPLNLTLIIILGLIMAGMFTMGLIFINEALPGTTERTTSILIAFGGLGGAFLPKMTGSMMDHFAPENSLLLLSGCALAMLIVVGVAVRFARKKSGTPLVQEPQSYIAAKD